MTSETTQDWYFTFGSGHEHPRGYAKIHGTFASAREEMNRRYNRRWAFQYSPEQFEGQAEKFNLYEVTQ